MAKTYMQKVFNEIIDTIKRNDNLGLGGNAYYYFAVSNDENFVIDESTFDFYTKKTNIGVSEIYQKQNSISFLLRWANI